MFSVLLSKRKGTNAPQAILTCAYHKVIFQQISNEWKSETSSVLNLWSTGDLGTQCDNLFNEGKNRTLGSKYQGSVIFY